MIKLTELMNEYGDFNDPVLMATRASEFSRDKKLSAQKAAAKKRIYGKKRQALEDKLIDINDDIKSAIQQRHALFIDMEEEAGEKGEDWSDEDANRYGQQLNDIDDTIQNLKSLRNKIETRLNY
jgi:hypothetical protein